jgi:acyl-CoA synthetase (AMP-forming)/AMP-acid ligase II
VLGERRLWALVEARADETPGGLLAVDEQDRVLTFGDLRARAEGVAAGFADLGVRTGTPVAWQLPTSIDAIVLVAALARLGATQIPMLPIYREKEITFIIGQTRPRLYVVPTVWRNFDYESSARRVVAACGVDCRVVSVAAGLPVAEATASGRPGTDAGAPGDDPVRWIFFTSGTTSDPKGALHTDGTIAAGSAGVAAAYAIDAHDRYPIVFPFTHIGGIGMLFIQLLTGCGALVVEQFDAARTPALMARHRVTIAAGGTPLALVYLQQQRRQPEVPLLPDLRAVMTGAAPKPPALHRELRTEMGGTGALACYGLTEAPFLTVSDVADDDEKRALTEGRPIGGAELRIVAADGRVCAPGEPGEIQARGPQICRGYLDTERNADAFVDGWFRTGDLGTLDAAGYLIITGRLKDVIIRRGENISAKEIEDELHEFPGVAEVAVIGLPDPLLGERACAVVVPREGAATFALDDIVAFCRARGLAVQKTPEQLEIVPALPRNASGKVLKHALRARLS